MQLRFRVVDLFAGPGGLAEGFSSVVDGSGRRVFNVVLSAEKAPPAHQTLTLRAFTRQFLPGQLPEAYYDYAEGRIALEELYAKHQRAYDAATSEALLVELGTPQGNRAIDRRLAEIASQGSDDLVVIGGPPCQAYSLVGRARNRGIAHYRAEDDNRHFLYKEYIRILRRLQPVAFVMENVKGILSSSVEGRQIFQRIRSDLQRAGGADGAYQLVAFSPQESLFDHSGDEHSNSDFVVQAENFGVPQARHRVIILGVRRDVLQGPTTAMHDFLSNFTRQAPRSVEQAIGNMPALRSGLSRGDSPEAWQRTCLVEMDRVSGAIASSDGSKHASLGRKVRQLIRDFRASKHIPPRASQAVTRIDTGSSDLNSFLQDSRLASLQGHESRTHMASDLGRYFFCSAFAAEHGYTPKAVDFPRALAPRHRNWNSGIFNDRFRVQLWGQPSSTIVSHIAKDGHYFIHPDPLQCRSLTVREAARLQTFPDNYLFLGNRTEQFTQVGNAVPPFLALRLAQAIAALLAPAKSAKRMPSR